MTNMLNYTILVIDDENMDRKSTYDAFLKKSHGTVNSVCPVFDVLILENPNNIDLFLRSQHVDAFFIDVSLKIEESNIWNVSFQHVLAMIKSYYYEKNEKIIPPVFMVSAKWNEGSLSEVNTAFYNILPSITPAGYYAFSQLTALSLDGETSLNGIFTYDRLIKARESINIVISRYYKKSNKQLGNSNLVRILHLSDLQYGDLNSTQNYIGLFDNIIAQLKSDNCFPIDLVVISGDVSMKGKPDEFDDAYKSLIQFFGKLWNSETNEEFAERIILVPGNHDYDINYTIMNCFSAKNKKHCRKVDLFDLVNQIFHHKTQTNYNKYGLGAFRDFGYKLTNNDVFYKNKYLNYIVDTFTTWGIRIIAINSVSQIDWMKTNRAGFEGHDIDEMLNNATSFNGLFTIVVSHHSPLLTNKDISSEEKSSLESVFHALVKPPYNCKVFLGGHRHISDEKAAINLNKQTYFCFEAASLRVDTNDKNYYRGFDVVELNKEHGVVKSIRKCKFMYNEDGTIKFDGTMVYGIDSSASSV